MAPMTILEQHISRWALPNEEIISWIKWDASADFDQIIIQSEADIEFERILNVDESVLNQEGIVQGKVVIDRNMLQIPGFMGFTSAYKLVPESERQIRFEVDFIKNKRRLEKISLKTSVIRPVIAIESEPGIDVSESMPSIPPATFRLSNKGRAPATDLTPFIEIINADAMTIAIKHTKEKIPHTSDTPFVHASEQMVPKFALKGSGNALFSIGFKFKDAIGNEYTSELVRLTVNKPGRKKVEVPIESILKGQPAMMLVPTRY